MTHKALRGSDLLRNRENIPFAPDFADLLDPEGWNIVVEEIQHEDMFIETKLEMLFKLKNKEEPFEGTLNIPYIIYKNIVQEKGNYVN